MGSLVCSPLEDSDVVPFVDNIKDDDLRECSVSNGTTQFSKDVQKRALKGTMAALLLVTKRRPDIVHLSLKTSAGDLVAVGGYSHSGNVWFLCTNLVDSHRKSFVKAIKEIRDEAWKHSTVLSNYMMWSNTAHRRFLEAIGADFSMTDHFSKEGETFVRFYIAKPQGA